MAEKTHQPTPKRLRDARKRGEVAFSTDFSAGITFVCVVVALWLLGSTLFGLIGELWRNATSASLFARPEERLSELLLHAGEVLLWAMGVTAAIEGVAAFAGSFAQVGGLAAWERLKPDVNRLNPAEGLKRIFSSRNLINLLKMTLKTLLLAALLFVVIRSCLDVALKAGYGTPETVMQVGARALLALFGWAGVIYLAVAGLDYAHQRYEHTKRLRMSIEDIRREHKDTEGDPVNLGRRRAAHFEAVYMSLGDRVRAASAVIHSQRVAVALQYLGE
jgi:type III secretion protein U